MRDRTRIVRILGKLRSLWERYPDLRLGQLLVNTNPHVDTNSLFFVEDDYLEKAIDKILLEGWS